MLYHNESYTIDPMVYYNTYRTSGPIGPIGSGLRSDITFRESGLPSGTPWSATLDGVLQSATSNSITFSEPIGKYYYSIGSVDHYSVSPESGRLCCLKWQTGILRQVLLTMVSLMEGQIP